MQPHWVAGHQDAGQELVQTHGEISAGWGAQWAAMLQMPVSADAWQVRDICGTDTCDTHMTSTLPYSRS